MEPSPNPTASPSAERTVLRPRVPKVKTLIAFSALIMLLFCVYVAYQASKAYARAIEDGKANATRLTHILADQVELTFLGVDLVLNRAVERQYFNNMFGGNLPADMEHNFRLWVDETPQIAGLMMVNERGVIEITASKKGYEHWYDYSESADRDPAFLILREDASKSLYIGRQRSTPGQRIGMMVMSRRINKTDGSFGGVMIAAIDPKFFSDFFATVDLGTHRFMALMLDDGTLLQDSAPKGPSREAMLAQLSDVAKRTDSTHVLADTQTFEDSIKIYAATTLKTLPIVTAILVDEQDFLSEWRSERRRDVSYLVLFTVFGSVLSYFALTTARQILRVEKSEAAAILASQAKSEFLANMSHELRTPLNAVIGFSEMLGAGYFGPLNEKQKERVQDINLCGTHLLQLISDILEFSKGEAGKLELYEEEIEVDRAIGEALRIVGERAKTKQITLLSEISAGLPVLVADKRKLRQILLNLLSNAIKFTPAGGRVTVGARMDPHGQMQLSVSDTGIGIAPEDIAKALAVFGQVHRSQSHEGTGLGLPLCKMFAELHGGKLVLTSEVGVGTLVRILFPASRIRGYQFALGE